MSNTARSLVCWGKRPILLGSQSTGFKVRVAGEAAGEAGTGQKLEHGGLGRLLCGWGC